MNDNILNPDSFNGIKTSSSSGASPGSSAENSNNAFGTQSLDEAKSRLSLYVPPENKCSICLEEMTDPTALSDCIHLFCFHCIQPWLNMKPECPLCKQVPNNLKHLLRIENSQKPSYVLPGEELNVQTLRAAYEMSFILPQTTTTPFEERKAVQSVIEKLRKEIALLKSAVITTSGRRATYLKAIQELEDERQAYSDLENMFAICSRREIFSQPAFRRVVYAERLYAQSIVSPRCSVVFSTDYIKKHMPMIKRQLLPFIIRDLAILKDNQAIDVDVYMEKIMEYLTDKICRTSILQFFKDRGVRGAVMFINNLKHFLATGQTLEVYDQNSTYTARWLRGLDYDNDVEFLGANNDILFLGNDEIQLLNSINRAAPTNRRRRRFNQRGPISDVVNLVSSSEDDSDVEVEEMRLRDTNSQENSSSQPNNLTRSMVFHPATDSWQSLNSMHALERLTNLHQTIRDTLAQHQGRFSSNSNQFGQPDQQQSVPTQQDSNSNESQASSSGISTNNALPNLSRELATSEAHFTNPNMLSAFPGTSTSEGRLKRHSSSRNLNDVIQISDADESIEVLNEPPSQFFSLKDLFDKISDKRRQN